MNERVYIMELKKTSASWKQITERANSVFKNNRDPEGMRSAMRYQRVALSR